jgi:hypothetical protein
VLERQVDGTAVDGQRGPEVHLQLDLATFGGMLKIVHGR